MLRAGGEGCVRGFQWRSTAYGKRIQQGYQKGRRLAGFGGTLSLEATDLLGTFGPQHFSTAAYTYRRDWQTWSGLVTLSWRQSFGRKYVRQAEDRSAGGLSRRIK